MSNIFKNAKFGDRFRLRDGSLAVFVKHNQEGNNYPYELLVEGCDDHIFYSNEGFFDLQNKGHCIDVISRCL